MTAVAGANLKVYGFTTVNGPHTITSSNVRVMGCYIAAEFTGTYASGDDATFDARAAIIAARRNNKTPTIRSACWAAPGVETVSGTDHVRAAGSCTVSNPNVVAPILQTDISTERGDSAMGTFKEPIVFYVTFTEA